MNVRPWRIGSVVLLAAIACGSSSAAAIVSREAGDRLQFKLEAMTQGGASHPPSRRMTTITEGELNSYLAFNAKEKIPRGLSQPDIRMLDRGQLTGSVFVDIDEYKRVNPPKGFTDPLTYVFGRVPVTARGTLRSYAGRANSSSPRPKSWASPAEARLSANGELLHAHARIPVRLQHRCAVCPPGQDSRGDRESRLKP